MSSGNFFYTLLGIATVVWLLSVVAGLLSIRWSLSCIPGRFRAALVSSLVSLAIAGFGWKSIHLSTSTTVNGQVQWRLDSKWFFIGALVLGAISLSLTLLNRKKLRPLANAPDLPLL